MRWLGNDDLARQKIVPLAVLEQPCRFRDAALAALEQAGRPYRIVLETPSLAALRAAVDSGLGITCRTTHFMNTVMRRRKRRCRPCPTSPMSATSAAIRIPPSRGSRI